MEDRVPVEAVDRLHDVFSQSIADCLLLVPAARQNEFDEVAQSMKRWILSQLSLNLLPPNREIEIRESEEAVDADLEAEVQALERDLRSLENRLSSLRRRSSVAVQTNSNRQSASSKSAKAAPLLASIAKSVSAAEVSFPSVDINNSVVELYTLASSPELQSLSRTLERSRSTYETILKDMEAESSKSRSFPPSKRK